MIIDPETVKAIRYLLKEANNPNNDSKELKELTELLLSSDSKDILAEFNTQLLSFYRNRPKTGGKNNECV